MSSLPSSSVCLVLQAYISFVHAHLSAVHTCCASVVLHQLICFALCRERFLYDILQYTEERHPSAYLSVLCTDTLNTPQLNCKGVCVNLPLFLSKVCVWK
jgi:hypothetical protein